ncbi:MAG: hypothetical protein ACOC44_18680 [Promethearchaeia archaeon]
MSFNEFGNQSSNILIIKVKIEGNSNGNETEAPNQIGGYILIISASFIGSVLIYFTVKKVKSNREPKTSKHLVKRKKE